MNIHPLFVHFPIGLLCTYALLEICFWIFPTIRAKEWVLKTKIFLVTSGTLWAIPTLITGNSASKFIVKGSQTSRIVEVHEVFALITFSLFLLITLSYFFARKVENRSPVSSILNLLNKTYTRIQPIAYFITTTPLVAVGAVIGLTTITITGALGASMVYGPDVDPAVSFIYRLFF